MKKLIVSAITGLALMLSSLASAESLEIRFTYQNKMVSDTVAEKIVTINFSEDSTFEFSDTITLKDSGTENFVEIFLRGSVSVMESQSKIAEPQTVYQITYDFGGDSHSVLATLPSIAQGSDEKTIKLSEVSDYSTYFDVKNQESRQMQESWGVYLSDAGI